MSDAFAGRQADPVLIQAVELQKSFVIEAGGAGVSSRLPVIKGISLSIRRGELLTIVGPSGAGKSTLLHLLGGLDRPSGGRVLVNGESIEQLKDLELAQFRNRTIGFIFQFHHLLADFTALENVLLPQLIAGRSKSGATEKATALLTAVGLGGRLAHRPGELSGGEQQRVAVARALALDPPIILADEPTGNLDTHTSDDVFGLLKGLCREHNMTLVMVTHNEKLAAQADRIIKLVDGKIE
ncbi:MAG TPA: ABC transporter ATP-binding protein [Nitrospiria bacterium]|nr:ABC transporter ATP-binding protein [Nitrospiria bacterium]